MRRLYPKHEGPIVGATMFVLTLLFTLLAWLSSGCATKPTPVVITHPVLMKVEKPEKPNKPASCWLESMPTEPEEAKMYMEDEDVVRRVFVHVRQWNEMVQFAHDMTMWGGSVAQCIEDLTEALTE